MPSSAAVPEPSQVPQTRVPKHPRIERFFSRIGIVATILAGIVGVLAVESWLFDPLPEETVLWDDEIGFTVGLPLVARCGEPLTRTRDLGDGRHAVKYAFSPVCGWAPVPNQPDEGIGLQGFRSPDLAAEKQRRRVVFLGGSTAWGLGVKAEETYAAELARRRPDLEIANAGVVGFASGQELMRHVDRVMSFEPDVVVSVTGWNDAYLASEAAQGGRLDCGFVYGINGTAYQVEDEVLRLRAIEDDLPALYRLLLIAHGRRSRLVNFYARMLPARARFEAAGRGRAAPADDSWRRRAAETFVANMHKIDLAVRAQGGRFVVFLQPQRGRVAAAEDRDDAQTDPSDFSAVHRDFERRVAQLGADRGLQIVSGVAAFRSHPEGHGEIFPDDVHLRPAGNVVLADCLEPLLAGSVAP